MQTLLITGANRGIGLGLVGQLLARGDRVIATARQPDAAEELAALVHKHPQTAQMVTLDVAEPASIDALFNQLANETLDVLVNNAGINRPSGGEVARGQGTRLGLLQADRLMEVYRTNAVGALMVTQAATALLKKGQVPRVINISSVMGSISETDSGGGYAYRMSKAAMNMATRVLAADLRPNGICVRSIHPGWVKTRMGGHTAPVEVTDSAAGILRIIDRTTLGDTGTFVNYDGRECAW